MSSVLERLPHGARAAVIRLRSMGDCVLTTPAVSILKQARPDVSIAIAVEDRFAALFEGNPDISEILGPRWTGLRQWRPHLCLNLHGGGSSAILTAFSGASVRAGFAHFRYSSIYNVRIPRAQEILRTERQVHTAEHLASAMFYLGAPRTEIPCGKLFAPPGYPPAAGGSAYAVIHPGASSAEKTWPATGFLDVASHLRDSFDLEPIFVAGPHEDLSAFARWRTIAGAPLAEIKSLMAGASLFVGNDSGPAHIAAAFGIPVVVIFGGSDPATWAPWRAPAEVVVASGGIASVSARQVMEALERLRVRA